MKIKILGSGGWEGIPSLFCDCKVCNTAKNNPNSKDNRTRPGILVESDTGEFLIEINPDIRIQSNKFNLRPIKNFLVSHWHVEHLYGLIEFKTWSKYIQKPRIYCSQKTKEWIDKKFSHINKEIKLIKSYVKFKLYGIDITPLPVFHTYDFDNKLKDEELNNTFGFLLEHKNKKIAYLADYFKIPKKTLDLIKNIDVIILDGTYLFDEYFPDKQVQNGVKMSKSHLHGKEILDFANSLDSKSVIFHSITHLSERTHEELQNMLPENMKLCFDGMEVKL